MLRMICLLVLCWMALIQPQGGSSTVTSDGPAEYTFRMVHRYPHDSKAFTQGLAFHDGYLYESTGVHGQSSLRRVELETGKVLQKVDLAAQYFGEGLAFWKERILQLTWTNGVGFIYNKDTFQMEDQFRYPTEGWGITTDDSRWILSDGTSYLYFLDPDNRRVERWLEVKEGTNSIHQLNELEYIKGEIFANIWQQDRIARISPVSGQVLGWIDLKDLLPLPDRQNADVLNGIAYDDKGNRLFVTGKYWPYVYEIRLVPKEKTRRIRS